MKKFKKITAVLLLIVICFSLCSCRELDELRESQAFFNENGIIYKDKLYKLVNIADNLNYDYIHEKSLNVSDPDVPVLISALIDFEYSINEDETIISGEDWYVREDKYSAYEYAVKNGINFTDIGFEYYDVILDKSTEYILTQKEKEQFLSLFSGELVQEDFETYEELYLFEMSDDKLFKRSDYYCLIVSDKGYFVRLFEDGYMTAKIYKSNDVADRMFDSFFERVNRNFTYEF